MNESHLWFCKQSAGKEKHWDDKHAQNVEKGFKIKALRVKEAIFKSGEKIRKTCKKWKKHNLSCRKIEMKKLLEEKRRYTRSQNKIPFMNVSPIICTRGKIRVFFHYFCRMLEYFPWIYALHNHFFHSLLNLNVFVHSYNRLFDLSKKRTILFQFLSRFICLK